MKCLCGSRAFQRITPMRVHWVEHLTFRPDSTLDELATTGQADTKENIRIPKTVTCAQCGRRSHNPDYKP